EVVYPPTGVWPGDLEVVQAYAVKVSYLPTLLEDARWECSFIADRSMQFRVQEDCDAVLDGITGQARRTADGAANDLSIVLLLCQKFDAVFRPTQRAYKKIEEAAPHCLPSR